jgi:hypothetical protein
MGERTSLAFVTCEFHAVLSRMNHPLPRQLALVGALFVVAASAQDPPARTPSSGDWLRDRINLLPIVPAEWSTPKPESVLVRVGNRLSEEGMRLFQRGDEGAWKTFEDDVVSFEIPDDPLLKVDVLSPEEPGSITIVGGTVGNADRSFERAYRISLDRLAPYLTLFVREADAFDDGTCFCGAISFSKWIATAGNLLQFDLLETGEVKKVQALGAKHRAVLLEWTHSALKQQAYARIGRSLRLKQTSPATAEEWRARMNAQPEGWAKRPSFGWLEPNDGAERVREILGKPTRIEGDRWVYVMEGRYSDSDGAGWRTTRKVRMKNGTFTRLENNWVKWENLEPARMNIGGGRP